MARARDTLCGYMTQADFLLSEKCVRHYVAAFDMALTTHGNTEMKIRSGPSGLSKEKCTAFSISVRTTCTPIRRQSCQS